MLAQVEILDQHSVKVKERLKADEVVPNLDKVPPWVPWGGAPRECSEEAVRQFVAGKKNSWIFQRSKSETVMKVFQMQGFKSA